MDVIVDEWSYMHIWMVFPTSVYALFWNSTANTQVVICCKAHFSLSLQHICVKNVYQKGIHSHV